MRHAWRNMRHARRTSSCAVLMSQLTHDTHAAQAGIASGRVNPNPSFKPTGFGRPLICGIETVLAWPPKTGGLTLR